MNVYEFHWYLNDLTDFLKNAQTVAAEIQSSRCGSPFLVADNLKKDYHFVCYCYNVYDALKASVTSVSLVVECNKVLIIATFQLNVHYIL